MKRYFIIAMLMSCAVPVARADNWIDSGGGAETRRGPPAAPAEYHRSGAGYLIVTTEALRPGFEELAAFRASPEGGGHATRILTTEAIHGERLEATPEARIRAAIRAEHLTNGVMFVVLGARADAIPPVRVWTPVDGIANNWTRSRGTPSDWYYACLDGEWTPTGSGIFGYSDFADLDLVPEVHVGRIPAPTADAVSDYVRRMRRFTSFASSAALRADHVLLHGLSMKALPSDCSKMGEASDGYPWIGEEGHPAGAVDSELWLRNIGRSRILAHRPQATFDLFFPNACGDPARRDAFTSAISIDRPADLNLYLAERPEFVAASSHGIPAGVGRLAPLSSAVPGNAWGVVYSVGCNTAQFDALSLANDGANTGMAPPEAGAFDGTWRVYALAEHLIPGGGEFGSLVYIASTREGYRTDGVGGIGGFSYAMLADYAGLWAQGGQTLGEMFSAHKAPYRSLAINAVEWRSLFVGLTYFGDPAIRPLRDMDTSARSFEVRFRIDGASIVRTAYPGQTLEEVAPPAERPGDIFLGWRDAMGEIMDGGKLLACNPAGLGFTAVWRGASTSEASAPPLADPALARESFDNGNGATAVHGKSLSASSQAAPVRLNLAATGSARWLTFHLRHEAGFDNDENCGVAVALSTATHQLEFRRRFDLGYTLALDGVSVGAIAVSPSIWHHVALRLGENGAALFIDGRETAIVNEPWLDATTVWFGGSSASGGYDWFTPGTLFIDEAAAFADEGNLTASEIFAAQSLAPGSVPLRRAMSAEGLLAIPAGAAADVSLVLSGAGALAPEDGAVLPELVAPVAPALSYPSGGVVWVSSNNLSRFGLDSFAWSQAGVAAPRAGLTAVAEPMLSATAASLRSDESFEMTARVDAARPVTFAAGAVFHAVDPRNAEITRPGLVEIDGATARVIFPPSSERSRLFRLGVSAGSE